MMRQSPQSPGSQHDGILRFQQVGVSRNHRMFGGTAAFVGTLGKGVTLVELFRDRIMYIWAVKQERLVVTWVRDEQGPHSRTHGL